MTGRPCRPSADLKRMWRTLLPGMPFPACGMPEDESAPAAGDEAPSAQGDPAPQGDSAAVETGRSGSKPGRR